MRFIKVLIIDQDQADLDVMHKRLKKKGLTVKAIGNADRVASAINDFRPDIIIIEPWNINQKDAIDMQELIRNNADIIIIVLTQQVSLEAAKKVISLGAFDYLIKPCPAEEILTVINSAVDAHR